MEYVQPLPLSPPDDPDLAERIRKLADYVARNGLDFEATIRDKELNNPLFDFLKDKNSEYYMFYQWRLYCSLKQYTEEEIEKVQANHAHKLEWGEFTNGCIDLTSTDKTFLILLLEQNNGSKETIKLTRKWILERAHSLSAIGCVVKDYVARVGSSASGDTARLFSQLLHTLYVINDVIYNSKGVTSKGPYTKLLASHSPVDVVGKLLPLLPYILRTAYLSATEDHQRDKVKRLVELWHGKNYINEIEHESLLCVLSLDSTGILRDASPPQLTSPFLADTVPAPIRARSTPVTAAGAVGAVGKAVGTDGNAQLPPGVASATSVPMTTVPPKDPRLLSTSRTTTSGSASLQVDDVDAKKQELLYQMSQQLYHQQNQQRGDVPNFIPPPPKPVAGSGPVAATSSGYAPAPPRPVAPVFQPPPPPPLFLPPASGGGAVDGSAGGSSSGSGGSASLLLSSPPPHQPGQAPPIFLPPPSVMPPAAPSVAPGVGIIQLAPNTAAGAAAGALPLYVQQLQQQQQQQQQYRIQQHIQQQQHMMQYHHMALTAAAATAAVPLPPPAGGATTTAASGGILAGQFDRSALDLAKIPVGNMANIVKTAKRAGQTPFTPMDVGLFAAHATPHVEPGRVNIRVAEFYHHLEALLHPEVANAAAAAAAAAGLVAKKSVAEQQRYRYDTTGRNKRERGASMGATFGDEREQEEQEEEGWEKYVPGYEDEKERLRASRMHTATTAATTSAAAATAQSSIAIGAGRGLGAGAAVGMDRAIEADNMGHQLLRGLGWQQGAGLGTTGSGITVPIRVDATTGAKIGGDDKTGVGKSVLAASELPTLDDGSIDYAGYRKQLSSGYHSRITDREYRR